MAKPMAKGKATKPKTAVKGPKKPDAKKSPRPQNLPEVGSSVTGTVVQSGGKGVIFSLYGTFGRLRLSDISTRFITGEEAAALYPTKTTVKNLIVSGVDSEGRLELRLTQKLGEPELGSVHKAVVKRVEKYGVIMGFPNSLARCLCEREELDDDLTKVKQTLLKIQPGHKYNVKVIRVENGKYWVSMKQSVLGESVTGYTQPVMDFVDPNIVDASAVVSTSSARPSLIEETIMATVSTPVNTKRHAVDILETEDIEEDSGFTTSQSKKQAKKAKIASKQSKEDMVRSKEEHLLSGDWRVNPQSPEEFERLLLVEANSAQTWIKYISYWLKMAEVGKAREVAERALKHSGFPTEAEKFNLWIAYLNMEAVFGGNAEPLFLRAVQYCDAKAMHHAMGQVWIRAGNVEKAKLMLERTTGKFHESRKAWLNLIDFLFSQKQFDEARASLQKAIKALPVHKHVRTTVKFAQLEFRSGNPERGATVFDTLIGKKGAAKTDIWSVYFDEQIKAGTPPVAESVDFTSIRSLFERAVGLRIKPFKMKFFFKRWIDFESNWGTDESVEEVKMKAVDYVESIGNE
jgi:rRNA biogenesis protein RRP5